MGLKVKRLFENKMSGYFVQKNAFPMHFAYIHTVYTVIVHMAGMHYILELFTVKIRADCMLHGSQKQSAHTKLQRFE